MNIANNGCSIRCGLVSIWRCEKPILKKVRLWFEKGFKPYLRFIVYNFEFILASVNEKSIDDLTYFNEEIHPIALLFMIHRAEKP